MWWNETLLYYPIYYKLVTWKPLAINLLGTSATKSIMRGESRRQRRQQPQSAYRIKSSSKTCSMYYIKYLLAKNIYKMPPTDKTIHLSVNMALVHLGEVASCIASVCQLYRITKQELESLDLRKPGTMALLVVLRQTSAIITTHKRWVAVWRWWGLYPMTGTLFSHLRQVSIDGRCGRQSKQRWDFRFRQKIATFSSRQTLGIIHAW